MLPDRLRIHTISGPFQVQGSKGYNILIFKPYTLSFGLTSFTHWVKQGIRPG